MTRRMIAVVLALVMSFALTFGTEYADETIAEKAMKNTDQA